MTELELPLERNRVGLYTVPVSIGALAVSSDPEETNALNFIVDTGANRTAIPLELALRLAEDDPVVLDQIGHAMTGQFETDLMIVEELDYGEGPRSVELAVIDVPYDQTVQASGLLGSNAFTGEQMVLDFPASQLELGVDLQIEHETFGLSLQNGLIKGTGQVRGRDHLVHVMIDTGATASIVNSAFAQQGQPVQATTPITVLSMAGRLQEVESNRQVFRGFQTSQLCMRQFEITVADLYAFESHGWAEEPAIIIGMDILHDTQIAIDHVTGQAQILGVGHRRCT